MKSKAEKAAELKALVRNIKRTNKTFQKASIDKRIVMVSKDVLSLLDIRRMKAKHGTYVRLRGNAMHKLKGDSYQMSDLLAMPNLPSCQVCAIGAGMVAATLRLNAVEVDAPKYGVCTAYDYGNKDEGELEKGMSDNARAAFPDELLRAMEQAFEGGSHGYYNVAHGEKRLRAIYQNLIDNKGKKFTAHDDPSYDVWRLQHTQSSKRETKHDAIRNGMCGGDAVHRGFWL